jgi:allophanate hydrolase
LPLDAAVFPVLVRARVIVHSPNRMSGARNPSLDLTNLRKAFAAGRTPSDVIRSLFEASTSAADEHGIWIQRTPLSDLLQAAHAIEQRHARGEVMPLYGVPFAVKDNIDVAGWPTTAACPAFAYPAAATAPAVQRLLDAGALLVGKTNLDQFATGLVGVRSPYGVPSNPFDPRYITGGSSSGSAAAVSRGLVAFALGTDTAGSGRVPAGFTNTVGFKPSAGLFSTRGVVPACRSLDCVSIFALTVADARDVAGVMASYDPEDGFSRPEAAGFRFDGSAPNRFRCGIPALADREFFGDQQAEAAFEQALPRLEAVGAVFELIDFAPLLETAALLYDGPWIAERLAGLEDFVTRQPEALLPVTREILREGAGTRGTAVFAGHHRLAVLRQLARAMWRRIDTLVVPTSATIYRQDEIAAQPRLLNGRLGRYVNFVNLLEMAGIAVPNGFRADGLPSGITFLGPWGSDARLFALGAAYHRAVGGPLGATGMAQPEVATAPQPPGADLVRLAVVGAHLSGMPLNRELTERGAQLVRTARTAPLYRLFALPGTTPPKPGLVRVDRDEAGAAIEVEVWDLPRAAFGAFFAGVVAPLCLGTLALEDGEAVVGFLCESFATKGATDISGFGGWRAYRAAAGSPPPLSR